MLQKLPLDISTFRELRESNYLYVDKTEYAYNLITGGRRFFLSRPRRFGKSLFISTLKEILESNKLLFKDLWIEKNDYHWYKYGVITLDFSLIEVKAIEHSICTLLQAAANAYDLQLTLNPDRPNLALLTLVPALHKKFGRAAVLIDEYDSPILKCFNKPDQASEIVDTLRSFFAAIKSLDQYIQFVFITGVSAFAKAGLFSGLNNLQIITLNNKFSAICGYTDTEVDHYFASYIQTWADNKHSSYQELRN